jgi:predicted esterase
LIPQSGSYSKVVLWFHGLGDTADGWADMMPSLNLEETKFILPTALSIPISVNGGMEMNGWSDIHGLSMDAKEDRDGFNLAAKRANAIIQAEIDKGIPASKIAIGGFSQGGALALHVTLRSPNAYAGCVALSTWLPLRDDYPEALSTAAKTMPIFQVTDHQTAVTLIMLLSCAKLNYDTLDAYCFG